MKISGFKFPILFCLIAATAFGADVTMTISPPIISLGERAQLTVEVRDAKRPNTPRFPAVNGLKFSRTSQSSQTRIVNGKVDRSISYTTTVYPQKTGDFQIGPFPYKVDGETKQLSGKLKVVATSGDITAAQSWNDVIFSKMTSNREKAYVQEPFELTLSIYSLPGLNLHGVENLRGMPDTGVTTETDWKGGQPTREYIDGTLYEVRRFTASMRAIGSGQFEFAPTVTAQIASQQQQQQRRDPFFSMLDRVQTTPVDLTAQPVIIQVLPLPTEGKPNGFSGAVGRFNFEVTATPKEVAPGDPISLKMTIVGEGNYDRIQPLALPVDAPFRLFGDAQREQRNNGVRFEQVISPRSADVTEIPSIDFSFFDSKSGSYRTVSSQPIPITVTAATNNTAQLFVAKENIDTVPSNTPFASESDIQRMTKWGKTQWRAIRPKLWTIPTAVGLAALLFGTRKVYHWRRRDVAWARRKEAPKSARKALKEADNAINNKDTSAFYEALGNALNSYFGHRLNLPPGNVTPPTVLQALQNAGIQTERARALFEQIEAVRYGLAQPSQDTEQMHKRKSDLESLLNDMEKARF